MSVSNKELGELEKKYFLELKKILEENEQ